MQGTSQVLQVLWEKWEKWQKCWWQACLLLLIVHVEPMMLHFWPDKVASR